MPLTHVQLNLPMPHAKQSAPFRTRKSNAYCCGFQSLWWSGRAKRLSAIATIPCRSTSDMKLFAVIRTRGDAWQPALPLERQADWNAHAAFMDDLHEEGFIVLGGPLDETPDILLVVRANDTAEIAQ